MQPRSARRLPLPVLCVLVLCLALAAALAGCGGDSSSSTEDAAESPFAGIWEPADASFDITWGEDGRSYSISSGGSGGGLEVAAGDAGLTVTLVGKSGERSDALPATVDGKTLSFAIPISEDMPTPTTLTFTGEGLADLSFEDQDSAWGFRKTDAITLDD